VRLAVCVLWAVAARDPCDRRKKRQTHTNTGGALVSALPATACCRFANAPIYYKKFATMTIFKSTRDAS
jgi:hypothetical protein